MKMMHAVLLLKRTLIVVVDQSQQFLSNVELSKWEMQSLQEAHLDEFAQ
jgi:hypothetical protein